MSECKHRGEGMDLFIQYGANGEAWDPSAPVGAPIAWRCVRCGDYASLGPAADDDERVSTELRGTAIADNWREQSYTPGADRFEWCPQNQSDELCDLCQAHVLAHAIAEHQTQDPTK